MAAWLGLLAASSALAQGTLFVYDQQSSTNEPSSPRGGGVLQQTATPYGQSFLPTLSSLDFVRLCFNDANVNDGLGATIYVNILQGSLSGAVVGQSAPVTMTNGFAGVVNFLFSSSVPLVPAGTNNADFFIQPIVQSGGSWNILVGEYNYSRGYFYFGGSPGGGDLWFREGIIAPEPGTLALGVVGLGALAYARRRFRRP